MANAINNPDCVAAAVRPSDEEPEHMQKPEHTKKLVMIALVIAGVAAFAVGVRGGWVVGLDYFRLTEQRETSR